MKKSVLAIFILIAGILLTSSCKKEETSSGALLTGTWSKAGPTGSGIDYVVVIDDAAKAAQIGYRFSGGGAFTQTANGTYTRTDSQITITDNSCPSINGVYSFTVNSTTWTMSSSTDACTGAGTLRRDVINGSWTRQ
jgi:hypothetical protein